MKEEGDAPACGRENDLIAFLYGELNDDEARTFRQHMHDCAACSTELAAFKDVRESVIAWRNESLDGVTSPVVVTDSIVSASERRPSAIAALREFFNLSPLWMKGAVIFSSLLFCVFTVLAIARWRETSRAPVIANQDKLYTEQQLNSLVERRVQEEIQRIKSNQQQGSNSILTANDNSQKKREKKVLTPGSEVAKAASGANSRRPLSRAEREQLAADLRLISSQSDTELDLLDDRVNQ